MSKTERREHVRISFYQGAIVLHDEAGNQIMGNINVRDISLGGVGFAAGLEQLYEKQKIYELELKADLPWGVKELRVKIAIIRVIANPESGEYVYGAVYRGLSKAESAALKEIINYQIGLNAAVEHIPERRTEQRAFATA